MTKIIIQPDNTNVNITEEPTIINIGDFIPTASSLDSLSDVDTTGVADGNVLAYDADTETWVASATAGGYNSAAFDVDFAAKDTDDLSEGASNFYYTEARVSANTDVAANTAARHSAVTVVDSSEIDFTLTGQQITAALVAASIGESKLDASVNASLDLADSSVQPGDNISSLTNDAGYITEDTTLTTEEVQDIVGGMFSGNTETLITATYQDADGTVDLVVNSDLSLYNNSTSGFITDYTVTEGDVTAHVGAINHDALLNFVANEHIDWTTNQGATNIHSGNIPDLSATYAAASHTHTLSNITDSGALAALDTVDSAQIDAEAITEAKLDVIDTPSDGEVLAYDSGTGRMEWVAQTSGVSDHGALSGLSDDDHTQYSLADGTRAFTGKVSYSTAQTFTGDNELVTKKYVDDEITAAGGYNDEAAQDAIGTILVDSSEINFTYDDATPSITASLVTGSVDVLKLDAGVQASLALADSSTQPGDNVSTLTNDSGYITDYTVTEADVTTHEAALTITSSQVSDFDTEVSNNTDVAANTSARHSAVTVTDSSEIDFTLTGQDITASLVAGSIDVLKLDAGVQASLGLADSSVQDLADLGLTATATELNYVDGVTSAIQTQLNGKASSSHTHTLTDVTDSGALAALDTVATAQIDNDAVTYAKIQNVTANRLLGRVGTSGDAQEIALGTNLSFDGTTLDATGGSMVYGLTSPDVIITLSGGTATAIDLSDGSTISSGTTHSTVLQAAIDLVDSTNGWIHIKGGTYNINATLAVNGNVRISGDGQEATELRAVNSLNANMIEINSTNAATHYRVIFEDFKMDGNDANQTSGSCIVSYGSIQSRFHRLHFENFYNYGIHLWDTGGGTGSYGHHNQVFDCLFDQSDVGAGTGIYMRNNDENTILASQFQYLKLGILDQTGFNQIEMNSFVNQGTGVYILDASRTRVVNNVFDLVTEYGVHLKGSFNTLLGNTFYENSDGASGTYSCVYIDYYGTNTISNNTFLVTGDTRSGIREVGNAAEDTYGNNIIIGNLFAEMTGATDVGGTGWTQSAIEETNTNYKTGNVSVDSSGTATEIPASSAGVSSIDDLSDVTVTSPSDGNILRWATDEFVLGDINNVTGTLAVNKGGTGRATELPVGDLLVGNGWNAMNTLTPPSGDLVGTTATQTLTNKNLHGAFVTLESEYDNGNSGTADTIAWNNGNIQKSTLTGNVTFTFTDPTTGDGRFSLRLVQDATGGRTVTWPASVKWPDGTAPTISTAANAEDIITFEKRGSSYYGVASQNFS